MAVERNVVAEDRCVWEDHRERDHGLGRCVKDRDWEDVTYVKKVGREDAAACRDYKGNFAG